MTAVAPDPARGSRPVLVAAVRGEWGKLTSLRSTGWLLVTALFAAVVLDAAACLNFAVHYPHMSAQDRSGFEPVGYSLNGLFAAQVALGVLGLLSVTGEYASGMIRVTFTAVPRRPVALSAKIAALAGLGLVTGLACSFGAFLTGQAILGLHQLGVGITAPHVLRTVVGGGLYLAAVTLLGAAAGVVLRRTAAALVAFFGLLFGTSVIAALLPGSWRQDTLKFMPANAGSQILTRYPGHGALPPGGGYAVLLGYVALLLAAGCLLVVRRDA